jgi:hypothetical protein
MTATIIFIACCGLAALTAWAFEVNAHNVTKRKYLACEQKIIMLKAGVREVLRGR